MSERFMLIGSSTFYFPDGSKDTVWNYLDTVTGAAFSNSRKGLFIPHRPL